MFLKSTGQPIAMGVLAVYGSNAMFLSGIVNPAVQGKGLQRKLIEYRLIEAKKFGAKRIFAAGVPAFGPSEANLTKCGFKLLCNRGVWRKRP